MKRPSLLTLVLSACLCCAVALVVGCTSNSSNTSARTSDSSAVTPSQIRIGSLATEDILPCWVAEEEGLFAAENLDVEIVIFQSATELIAGITSGAVDFAMTDPMVAASIYASGTDVQVQWVTLGADASQGRFGILTADDSVTSINDLAGVPVGVGSNTILEYVMDKLFQRAGVPDDQIISEELQKLPVRYQAVASGQVKAVALPASFLALGEASGLIVVADDTTGENLSQSNMISRGDLATAPAFARAWDAAVARINAQPDAYRSLLVQKASLPESIADSYAVSSYPTAALPSQDMVDEVLAWMKGKNYLDHGITYDAKSGSFQGR